MSVIIHTIMRTFLLCNGFTRASLSTFGKVASDRDKLMIWESGVAMTSALVCGISEVILSGPGAVCLSFDLMSMISCLSIGYG